MTGVWVSQFERCECGKADSATQWSDTSTEVMSSPPLPCHLWQAFEKAAFLGKFLSSGEIFPTLSAAALEKAGPAPLLHHAV